MAQRHRQTGVLGLRPLRMARDIKDECAYSGGTVMSSLDERLHRKARCPGCGRLLKITDSDVVEKRLPRHGAYAGRQAKK